MILYFRTRYRINCEFGCLSYFHFKTYHDCLEGMNSFDENKITSKDRQITSINKEKGKLLSMEKCE
jgi:hypothetical protein